MARTGLLRFSVIALAAIALALGSAPVGETLAYGAPVNTVDGGGADDVGAHTSLALDANDYPVISYYDVTNGDLKIAHCNDAFCAGGDESVTAPDTADNVGMYTSLALDGDGYPVVAYYDQTNAALKVLHCNDADCAGDDESITTPDPGAGEGAYASLALDSSGYPVVSYHDETSRDLKVLHCNDADCAAGDESITSPDTEAETGIWTSLQLDASGYPVVAFFSDVFGFYGGLMILHCNDANCAGGDDDATQVLGGTGTFGIENSLELDASGNPVVSHYFSGGISEFQFANLVLSHCDDPGCAGIHGGGESAGWVGRFSSLELDASGNPVVAYFDALSDDLKLIHCNDADCAGDDESMIWPDTGPVTGYASLELDAGGAPVISYYADSSLKLFRCSTPACNDKALGGDSDGDGCTDAQELGANEDLGGRRNPLNPYDFFDPDGNGTVDLFFDIFAVAGAFGTQPFEAGYDLDLDRGSPYGGDVWDLRNPDGGIDLFTDVFGIAYQFGHHCV
ncbi:MAG: flexitail domain-containing putative surface protein [Dehalococcoidia bacterium]